MASPSRLQSMTGYARAVGNDGPRTWTWEVKSVNGKGLEARFRLPQGSDSLELPGRALAAERFKRGNLSVSLSVRREGAKGQYRINEELLTHLVETVSRLDAGHLRTERPSLEVLLNVKGVVESAEEEEADDEESRRARDTKMLADLRTAFDALATMRAAEGERLAVVLAGQLAEIERLTRAAEALGETQPHAIRERLTQQLADVMSAVPQMSEERLLQEVALLATRADVREELDRLDSHIAAARDLVKNGGVVGRKLDFLCQEFTREANTLCSKASGVELTRIGIELKTVIEQFREQVQNIE
jgi:uncharacterized protein (TIGR00255 family)